MIHAPPIGFNQRFLGYRREFLLRDAKDTPTMCTTKPQTGPTASATIARVPAGGNQERQAQRHCRGNHQPAR